MGLLPRRDGQEAIAVKQGLSSMAPTFVDKKEDTAAAWASTAAGLESRAPALRGTSRAHSAAIDQDRTSFAAALARRSPGVAQNTFRDAERIALLHAVACPELVNEKWVAVAKSGCLNDLPCFWLRLGSCAKPPGLVS